MKPRPRPCPQAPPGASSTNLATGPAASAPTGPSVYKPHDDRSLCVLACGPEQKATLALTREDGTGGAQCFISQHIGDLENAETFDAWQSARARMEGLFDLRPSALACDAHPGYLSSQWAREQARATGLPLVQVQHHHAHIAAVIAEAAAHGEIEANARVIGIAFDGTGAGAVYHSDSPNSGIMRPGSDSDTEAACHNGVKTGSACRDIYTAASETSANGAKARAPKLNIADMTPAAGAANRPPSSTAPYGAARCSWRRSPRSTAWLILSSGPSLAEPHPFATPDAMPSRCLNTTICSTTLAPPRS